MIWQLNKLHILNEICASATSWNLFTQNNDDNNNIRKNICIFASSDMYTLFCTSFCNQVSPYIRSWQPAQQFCLSFYARFLLSADFWKQNMWPHSNHKNQQHRKILLRPNKICSTANICVCTQFKCIFVNFSSASFSSRAQMDKKV